VGNPIKIDSEVTMPNVFLQEWPWWVVYGVTIAISSYFAFRMRKKGVVPYHTQAKFEKHKKKIDSLTNILLVSMVILAAIMAIITIYPLLQEYRNPFAPLDEKNRKLLTGIICMLLTLFLGIIVLFTGMTTFFQRNLTFLKRFVLLAISILPLSFVVVWFFIGDGTAPSTKLKMMISYAITIGIINGPSIVSGTSFFELAAIINAKFSHKIR
jgi:peptidoglycan biosynthesis protein MviN/MurJ (putative lipid II flippase)